MLIAAFFSWWYGPGWLSTVKRSKFYFSRFAQNFSIGILLKTLFSPWKQIDANVSSVNQPLEAKFQKILDRLISRLVGFGVRILTLFVAGFGFVGLVLVRGLWIALWPILPVLPLVAVLYSVGVF